MLSMSCMAVRSMELQNQLIHKINSCDKIWNIVLHTLNGPILFVF